MGLLFTVALRVWLLIVLYFCGSFLLECFVVVFAVLCFWICLFGELLCCIV